MPNKRREMGGGGGVGYDTQISRRRATVEIIDSSIATTGDWQDRDYVLDFIFCRSIRRTSIEVAYNYLAPTPRVSSSLN